MTVYRVTLVPLPGGVPSLVRLRRKREKGLLAFTGPRLLGQDLQASRVYSNPESVTLCALARLDGADRGAGGHDNLLLLAAGRALHRGDPRYIHNRESTPPALRR